MTETLADITDRLVLTVKPLTPEQNAERERMSAKRAEEAVNLKVGELRANWGAPDRHLKCRAEFTGPWGQAFEKLKSKVGHGSLLALVGERGNGKTQMAVELMRHVTRNLKSAKFASATGFFMAIKETFRKDTKETERGVIEQFESPSFLVIDEYGKRGGSEWENNLLFELLNRRYNRLRDTLLIDNRSKDEFTKEVGPSVASRMNEGGGIIECDWETFRK